MKWDLFYEKVQDMPVIETKMLRLLFDNKNIELQLNRWIKQGKIIQLKRGFYILEENYRKLDVFEPYIASILKSPSYISLEKALEMHHLIPDVVFSITSVTTKQRPAEFVSRIGRFKYSSIKKEYFWGYHTIELDDQKGYLADPEKALIDLFYFKQKRISIEYIQSLRLQNIELLKLDKLERYAVKLDVSFVNRAVSELEKLYDLSLIHI